LFNQITTAFWHHSIRIRKKLIHAKSKRNSKV
jgi:hypothetical protein